MPVTASKQHNRSKQPGLQWDRNAPERRSGSFFGSWNRVPVHFRTRIHLSNAFENVILTLAFRVHGSNNS